MGIIIDRDIPEVGIKSGDELSTDQIKTAIEQLDRLYTQSNNYQTAAKIILNSIYGVLGFLKFILYSRQVAETVTLGSQHLIKFTIKILNDYFEKYFFMDKKLHEKMMCTFSISSVPNVVNYADTDSVFIVLDKVFKSSTYNSEVCIDLAFRKEHKLPAEIKHGDYLERIEFYLKMHQFGIKPYLEHMFRLYTKKVNGFENHVNGNKILKLGLENINDKILWVAKKMYIKNPIWDDGKINEPLKIIKATGLNMNKGSTPKFIREELRVMTRWIIENGQNVNYEQLSQKIKQVKAQFETKDIEDICFTQKVNDYSKWILKDSTALELAPKCPEHVRAAAIYNYRLFNSKYKGLYPFIGSGTKIQYFLTKNPDFGVFGFPVGGFTPEIALLMDYDEQFKKVFLNPLNSILGALGVPKIHADLILIPTLW